MKRLILTITLSLAFCTLQSKDPATTAQLLEGITFTMSTKHARDWLASRAEKFARIAIKFDSIAQSIENGGTKEKYEDIVEDLQELADDIRQLPIPRAGHINKMRYGINMPFYKENCFKLAQENTLYRKELFTTSNSQLVLMSIPTGDEIPKEIHVVDQIFIFVEGSGEALLNKKKVSFAKDDILIVPAGTIHTIRNTGPTDLKLVTLYTPPHHEPGTVHTTKHDELQR